MAPPKNRQSTTLYKNKSSSFRLGGLVSKLSVRKTNNNNDTSVVAKPETSSARTRSMTSSSTDSSTGRGSSSNSSVGSQEQKAAQADMIRYFEEGSDKSISCTPDRQKTGPVDLDLLEDNFHYYDEDKLDAFLESTVDTNTQNDSSPDQKGDAAADDQPDDDSEETAPVDNQCKVEKIQFSPDDATIIGMPVQSRPVDMDAIMDLETQFDAILDEHEDNFQVWEANRQSINAIRVAEERAKRKGSKYGQSLRRQRDLKRWSS